MSGLPGWSNEAGSSENWIGQSLARVAVQPSLSGVLHPMAQRRSNQGCLVLLWSKRNPLPGNRLRQRQGAATKLHKCSDGPPEGVVNGSPLKLPGAILKAREKRQTMLIPARLRWDCAWQGGDVRTPLSICGMTNMRGTTRPALRGSLQLIR